MSIQISRSSFGRMGRAMTLALVVLYMTAVGAVPAQAQSIGGHVGAALPLTTRVDGRTINNVADNFAIGFPFGVTFRRSSRMALDFEFVPMVHDRPRNTSFTVHPGVVWDLGRSFGAGIRAAFDVNQSSYGFTPLVNHSWRIEGGPFTAYFVEAVFPVRFNRPTGGPSSTPVSFAVHTGFGF